MPMQTTDQWGSLLPKGLGNDQEAQQATGAMRQSPWYQDWAKKNNLQFEGDAYGNAKLNDDQQQDLYNLAQKNGIGLNNKYDQIDENGNISEAHHKLRNTLIAAAIAAAGATGLGAAGIGPLSGLFGAGAATGAGAGTGFGAAGAGLSGAATGAAGAGAGAGSVLGSLAPVVGAASSPLLNLGMNLPSTQVGSGMMPAITGGAGSAVSGGAADAGGVISNLVAKLKNPSSLADLSSILGSMSSGEKANRVAGSDIAGKYDQAAISAQNSRNSTESDALKKLAQTNYILSGGSKYNPNAQIQLNGQSRALPDFGLGPIAPSAAQKQGAASLQSQLLPRLAPGGTSAPDPNAYKTSPGLAEDVGSWGGVGAGIGSTLLNMFRK